jgi:hypothetical protein
MIRTFGDLLLVLERLEPRGLEHLSSRYKPLALLWIIGRFMAGRERLATWYEFREEMPPIQERYGRPLDSYEPQYPFWDLRTSGLWEVVGLSGHTRDPYSPQVALLDSQNPSAGLTVVVASLLERPGMCEGVLRALTSRFFVEFDQRTLLADVGLSKFESIADIRRVESTPAIAHIESAAATFGASNAGEQASTRPQPKPPAQTGDSVGKIRTSATAVAQGRQQDPLVAKAVEVYAEDRAISYFDKKGWTVSRVGHMKLGYDLHCTDSSGGSLHIEVKGTQGLGQQVILTANEVVHNQTSVRCNSSHALFVVSEIQLDHDGEIRCFGGSERCIWPWVIEATALSPVQYRYRLPL